MINKNNKNVENVRKEYNCMCNQILYISKTSQEF